MTTKVKLIIPREGNVGEINIEYTTQEDFEKKLIKKIEELSYDLIFYKFIGGLGNYWEVTVKPL